MQTTSIIIKNSLGEEFKPATYKDLKINESLDSISTFSFTLESFDLEDIADRFGIGSEVQIILEDTDYNFKKSFKFWINQEPRTLNGLLKTIQFSGTDYLARFQYKLVTDSFEDRDVGLLVSDLIEKYFPNLNMKVIYTTGYRLTVDYNSRFLYDVLSELAETVGYYFYLDFQNVFWFKPFGELAAGETQKVINTGDFKKGTANLSKDASKLVNKLYLAGGKARSRLIEEKYIYQSNMNKIITLNHSPYGVKQTFPEFDNKHFFAMRRNYTENKLDILQNKAKSYSTNTAGDSWLVEGYWPEKLEGFTLEMDFEKDQVVDDSISTNTYRPLFLEKETASSSWNDSVGIGVFISGKVVWFYAQNKVKGTAGRVYASMNESVLWEKGSRVKLQCRYYDNKFEIWVNGVLKVNKKHSSDITVFTEPNIDHQMRLPNTKLYKVHQYRISFFKRSENELKSFIDTDFSANRIYVSIGTGTPGDLQLRAGTKESQYKEVYNVLINQEMKTLDIIDGRTPEELLLYQDKGTPLKDGDIITVKYAFEYAVSDILENTPSQQKYGVFEDKLTLTTNNREYVRAMGYNHLQKYSKPLLIGSLEPFRLDLKVGELITLNIPELKIFESDVKITAINYSSSQGRISCSINLEEEQNISKVFAKLIKRIEFLEEEKYGEKEEDVVQVDKVNDRFEFLEMVSFIDYPKTGFVFDTALFDYSEFQ